VPYYGTKAAFEMMVKLTPVFHFSCAFGINTNSQEDADNQVLNCGRQIFSTFTCKNWIMSGFVNLFLHFPSILKVKYKVNLDKRSLNLDVRNSNLLISKPIVFV